MCVVKLSVCDGEEEGHVRIDSQIRLIIFGLKPSVTGLGAVEQSEIAPLPILVRNFSIDCRRQATTVLFFTE